MKHDELPGKVGRTLYRDGATYYRLFAHSISPNGCWLIAPVLRELLDIDAATGSDVYGEKVVEFDACGTVPSSCEFIRSEVTK